MGMLINGVWENDADLTMQDGAFKRSDTPIVPDIPAETQQRLLNAPQEFALIASFSCPWSHAAVLAWQLKGFSAELPLQRTITARVEGYAMRATGAVADQTGATHIHNLYTKTNSTFTGRVTVPLLWDLSRQHIVANASDTLIHAFNGANTGPNLLPTDLPNTLLPLIYNGLSNAVYRAGLAQTQAAYDTAVHTVFSTLDTLEDHLTGRDVLHGNDISVADLRLFATLVRFDTVYATHFRCTRNRLTDFPALWRYTRRIYNPPDIASTVDFAEIQRGYYLNDGDHNPHGIISQAPTIDWSLD